MFGRKQTLNRRITKVGKRVVKIATPDLGMWADQAINDAGRSLTAYLRRGDVADLEDAVVGAEALATILTEMRTRSLGR